MKVYISPNPNEYHEDGRGSGGIWRVINAQARWLPEYGVEVVGSEPEADLIVVHAGSLIDTQKPMVHSNHGLYWSGDMEWAPEYWQYNASVIEAARRAHKITVPSDWVAQCFRKDMKVNPVVIPHGVDLEDFPRQGQHGNYILWGKPRVDVVSDPAPMNEIASKATDLKFLSTYGRPAQNVQILGSMPYAQFQGVIRQAMIWLATTRETGDIASREAMALGIPVVGWKWGATGELVQHMITGYLAEPGDYNDLIYGLHYCIDHRDSIGEAARDWIEKNGQWKHLIGYYADTYKATLEEDRYECDLSIVIPAYNYAQFIGPCLSSVFGSSLFRKEGVRAEIVVVDDASTDNTQGILSNYDNIRVIRHETNQGLSAALNTGHSIAQGKYITNLDADNLVTEQGLEILYNALESKPWLDVASGGLAIFMEDGQHRRATDWPFGKVDVEGQFKHYNQVASTCMMRARSVKRLGGYRLRQHKNEDGEFWCRAMSAGLRFEQVTDEPVFVYRWHGANKSKTEGGEDDRNGPLAWNFHYPWKDDTRCMPFACTQYAERGSWAVRSYESPHVAVVIACGPGHEHYLQDALDSVVGQTFPEVECVVCNDTGKPLDVAAMGHPWVKVVDTPGRMGPAIARNTAIAAARAPLIVPLDADDMLYPDWIMKAYEAWLQHPENLVYGDCDLEDGLGKRRPYQCGVWTWEHIMREAIYQVTILYPKQWWQAMGGYPTDQPLNMWEDWLFGVKLHLAGIGATYLQGTKWGVYRQWTQGSVGSKNAIDNDGFGTEEFKAKYNTLIEWVKRKEESMACPSCRNQAKGVITTPTGRAVKIPTGPERMFVYDGPMQGSFTVNSAVTPGKKYQVEPGQPFVVPAGDAELRFKGLRGFFEVLPEEEPEGSIIPAQPPSVPELQTMVKQPEPVVVEEKPPEEVVVKRDDLNRLKLDEKIIEKLREGNFHTVADLQFDIRAGQGSGIMMVQGIGPQRYKKVLAAVQAMQ